MFWKLDVSNIYICIYSCQNKIGRDGQDGVNRIYSCHIKKLCGGKTVLIGPEILQSLKTLNKENFTSLS